MTDTTPGRPTAVPRPRAAAPGPVAASFAAHGMFWGTWAGALANIQHTFDLTYGQVGILLAVAIALAGLTGAVMGHRAERWGTGRMLTVALAAWAVLLTVAGWAPTLPVFVVSFVAAEVAAGSVDTAMNAAATQRLAGRPGALVRFHSLFNTGALSGAAVAGLVLHAGVSWRWLWPGLGVGVAAIAVWTVVGRSPTTPAPDPGPGLPREATTPAVAPGPRLGPLAQLHADGLLLFLLVFAIAEVTEGGIDTWGVLYLRTHLAAGVLLGAGAYVVGQSVAATTRSVGGPFLGRLSARMALVVGGLVAAVGIGLESVSPQAFVAAVGMAIGAGGASLFWPLVMSEAILTASRPTAAVGAFTAAGYVGLVAGAPVIGWVSDTWGLAWGLRLLALLALAVSLASYLRRGRPPAVATGVGPGDGGPPSV